MHSVQRIVYNTLRGEWDALHTAFIACTQSEIKLALGIPHSLFNYSQCNLFQIGISINFGFEIPKFETELFPFDGYCYVHSETRILCHGYAHITHLIHM